MNQTGQIDKLRTASSACCFILGRGFVLQNNFFWAVGSFCKIAFFARAGGSMNVGVLRRGARRGAEATGLDGWDAESLASSDS